ncbi:hypothetical protein [Rubrivirga litoralis]|uniref:Uncharacterized protein n=1 Tax=Rubrivirga litoralis TaxID=3075598 RepID=A0ABU3BRQ2_9BACT|nr:hypothetical protein [Rubrivirga sp. F394]MDT0631967.1 hypothetical protein [Rubrivirga sp. F394]
MPVAQYDQDVFVNCPFDDEYRDLFDAIVFAVHDCGFRARCALEADDGTQVRFEKIVGIIQGCRYGVHDLSRTELDVEHGLPRFNMPLELGLFLGASRFGGRRQKQKNALILDTEEHRYQRFISDISGQDVHGHGGSVAEAVETVRDWLRSALVARGEKGVRMRGGEKVYERYRRFLTDLPAICEELELNPAKLPYNDYTTIVVEWILENR